MTESQLPALDSGIVQNGSLSHCNSLLGHLNRREPSLILLLTPAFPAMTSQNVSCENGIFGQSDMVSL